MTDLEWSQLFPAYEVLAPPERNDLVATYFEDSIDEAEADPSLADACQNLVWQALRLVLKYPDLRATTVDETSLGVTISTLPMGYKVKTFPLDPEVRRTTGIVWVNASLPLKQIDGMELEGDRVEVGLYAQPMQGLQHSRQIYRVTTKEIFRTGYNGLIPGHRGDLNRFLSTIDDMASLLPSDKKGSQKRR